MRNFYLLFFFIITTTIFAQDAEDFVYETPYVRHFTYKEYGMHTQCWHSTQDSTGKLYIANGEGVAIYDGVNWEKLPLQWAWRIEDLNNTIYVANNNISYIETDSITLKPRIKKIFIDTAKYQISTKIFQESFKTKKSVFFSNYDNLVEIRDKKFINSYKTFGKRVFTYNNNVFIQSKDTIKSINNVLLKGLDSLKEENIYNIFTINNIVYILTNANKIYKANIDENNKYQLRNLRLELDLEKINGSFSQYNITLDNDIIMSLHSGGVLVYNTISKKKIFVNKGLNEDIGVINALSYTNNKNIIACTNNGFYLINYNSPVKYIKSNNKLKSIISSIIEFNGYTYVSTLDGLYKLKKQQASNKYSIKKLNKKYNSFLAFKIHNNKLYVSSRDGVDIVENDSIIKIADANIGFYFIFSKLYPDLLYVGTATSLIIYKKTNNKYKQIYKLTDLTTNINSIVEYKNNLWFVYSDTEIAKLSLNNKNFDSMKVFNLKTGNLQLNVFNNRLFVTSEFGEVSHYYDYKTEKFLPWNIFINKNTKKTQYYSLITQINTKTYFGISANSKIITKIITKKEGTKFIDKPYKSIGSDQYFGAFYDSTLNKLFIGGSGFILTVDNDIETAPTINNYHTYIRKVIINDSITKPLKTLQRKSKIKFLFSSNSIYNSEKTLYSYMLEGYDDKWSDWTTDAYANYTNLNYGDYTFKVKSKNIYDQISDETYISFVVEKAFYQTILFKILIILLLILVIYIVVYINGKRLKAINKKLELQVAERTREIKKQNIELEKLSIVAQETDNSVLLYDSKFNLEWINEGEIQNFGYTLEQIWEEFGTNIEEISFYPKIKEVIKKLKETKKSVHYSSSGKRKNGKIIWTRTTLTPLLDKKGNIKKIIAIDSDITEVKQAEEKIKLQNTLINHSIEYAKRIQTAVLPSKKEIENNTKDSFILHKPKDIVSGDFYWFHTKQDKTIIVSADCTGHGVPGGFMSMIGNTILNNIIKEQSVFEPNIILDYLNEKINAIVNKDAETGQTDGMDLSIALIDKENNTIELASANQNIFFVRNNKIVEFYGDIWSIGGVFNEDGKHNFTSKKFKLNEITHLYFSTDGYYDQFGGNEDKKLMKDIFIDLIIKNYKLPMENQKQVFEDFLNNWKKDLKQTDDIQVIGILL